MLSSALIGCLKVQFNIELCSDWLFHSAAHFSSSHSRKETRGKYIYLNTFSRSYIVGYTVNKMRASGSPLLICGALKLYSNS